MIEEEKMFVEINEKEFKISNIKEYGIGHGVIEVEVDDEENIKSLEKGMRKWTLLFSALMGKDISSELNKKKIIKRKTTYVYISTYTGDNHQFTGTERQISNWICTLRKEVGKRAVMKDRIQN